MTLLKTLPDPLGDRAPLLAAAVLGAGGGLRSFAPPAVLAARGAGPLAGGARFIAYGAATGELIADKQAEMGSRWAPRGLALRVGFSGAAGYELAGPAGAALAATVALGSARLGSSIRTRLLGRRGAPAAAVLEDAISYGLVTQATRLR